MDKLQYIVIGKNDRLYWVYVRVFCGLYRRITMSVSLYAG